eukprot:4898896-Prymnesium_polylepis.1
MHLQVACDGRCVGTWGSSAQALATKTRARRACGPRTGAAARGAPTARTDTAFSCIIYGGGEISLWGGANRRADVVPQTPPWVV